METAPKVGDIGRNVAANLRQTRADIGVSVRALSERLKELGQPILPSGVTKIEQGMRRVDVDELVAIALALRVSPTTLLIEPSMKQKVALARHPKSGAAAQTVWELDTAVKRARAAGNDPAVIEETVQSAQFQYYVDQLRNLDATKKGKSRGKRS